VQVTLSANQCEYVFVSGDSWAMDHKARIPIGRLVAQTPSEALHVLHRKLVAQAKAAEEDAQALRARAETVERRAWKLDRQAEDAAREEKP
jgi:hypothetical protein